MCSSSPRTPEKTVSSPRPIIKTPPHAPGKGRAIDAYPISPSSPEAEYAAKEAKRKASELAAEVAADNAEAKRPKWPARNSSLHGTQTTHPATSTSTNIPRPSLPPADAPVAHTHRTGLYCRIRGPWTASSASASGVLPSRSSSPTHPWGWNRRWTCCKCGAQTHVEQGVCSRVECGHKRCADAGLGCREK